MSSNLPANINNATYEELAALIGQDDGGPQNTLGRLRINTDPVDDDGKPLPYGFFSVYVEGKGYVFGKPVNFRPFIQVFQYSKWDAKEKKFVNKSIMAKSFRQEIPDELGGFKCGKVAKNDLASLTEKQKEDQKAIKCYRILYGVVTFKGKTKEGEEVEVREPVMLKLRGKNFMPIAEEVLDVLQKQKKLMFNYNIVLNNRREKNGDTAYFVIEPSVDLTAPVDFTQADFDLLKKFQETIDLENKAVMKKYEAALRKNAAVTEDEDDMVDVVTGDLDDDLEDDISDLSGGTILDAG